MILKFWSFLAVEIKSLESVPLEGPMVTTIAVMAVQAIENNNTKGLRKSDTPAPYNFLFNGTHGVNLSASYDLVPMLSKTAVRSVTWANINMSARTTSFEHAFFDTDSMYLRK